MLPLELLPGLGEVPAIPATATPSAIGHSLRARLAELEAAYLGCALDRAATLAALGELDTSIVASKGTKAIGAAEADWLRSTLGQVKALVSSQPCKPGASVQVVEWLKGSFNVGGVELPRWGVVAGVAALLLLRRSA